MTKTAEKDYKSLYAELEAVIDALQSTDLDLEDATKQYEKGMGLIVELEKKLKNSENKITEIKNKLKA
jgi:exodeoxyribonuclease VII small subunit